MSEIINIANFLPAAIQPRTLAPFPTDGSNEAAPAADVDQVEFSVRGRALSIAAAESSSFRLARTQAIRTQIENGTYETPERIRATVERLLDVFG